MELPVASHGVSPLPCLSASSLEEGEGIRIRNLGYAK